MNCRSRLETCRLLLFQVFSKKAGAPCTRPFMLKLRGTEIGISCIPFFNGV